MKVVSVAVEAIVGVQGAHTAYEYRIGTGQVTDNGRSIRENLEISPSPRELSAILCLKNQRIILLAI